MNDGWLTDPVTVGYDLNALDEYTSVTVTQPGTAGSPGTPGSPGTSDSDPLQYDAEGNLTRDGVYVYDYDAEDRLTRVTAHHPAEGSARLTFAYDYLGRRVRKVVERFSAAQSK